MLMEMAQIVAKRGTCPRLQVGAVFSKEGRVIAMGYNGVPAGLPHCEHILWEVGKGTPCPEELKATARHFKILPKPGYTWEWDGQALNVYQGSEVRGCQRAEHAERNGIAFAARYGVALDGSELHVTHAPCAACAMSIINAGIVTVTYDTPYRITAGVELLRSAGLEVIALRLLE
jgi:dCMP deaminase